MVEASDGYSPPAQPRIEGFSGIEDKGETTTWKRFLELTNLWGHMGQFSRLVHG
jgi:hypothetical protein